MPNLRLRIAFGVSTLLLDIFLNVLPASALPVFAHRYGFSCGQCHTTVPQLNAFGRQFQANGFRLGGARAAFPIAIKVESAYSSGASAGLPKAVVDEVEVLSAGSVGRNTSYWFEQYVVDGGLPGRPRDIWVDFRHELGVDTVGPSLHAKLGEFSLPLPVDPETQRPTLANYALFDQTVGANDFDLFAPRVGGDFYFRDERAGVEAHAIVAAHGDVLGTLSKTLANGFTGSAYRYQGRRNLGPIGDRFYRQGYALGYSRERFDATVLAQTGNDSSADGLGQGARSSGGMLAGGWHFSTAAALYARYDDTYDPFSGRTTATILSFVTRPSRNTRFTLEASRESDRTYQLATGLLFAY